jgi:tetratricopeptide (TPR) repeat protein
MKRVILLFGCALLSGSLVYAEEFQGADAVLKRVNEAAEKAAKLEAPKTPVGKLQKDLAAFQAESGKLPPAEAAAKWIELFDRLLKLRDENAPSFVQSEASNPLTYTHFLEALPPVESWDAISKALQARAGRQRTLREMGLGLIVAAMRAAPGVGVEEMAAARAILSPRKTKFDEQYVNASMNATMFVWVFPDFLSGKGTPEEQIAYFELSLAREKASPIGPELANLNFDVPDLVNLCGEPKARPLLKRAFALGRSLSVKGDKTRRLAAEMALKDFAALKYPLWGLVKDLNDGPLYEKMLQRFPHEKAATDEDSFEASMVYLAWLIAGDRLKDAAKFFSRIRGASEGKHLEFNPELLDQLAQKGFGEQTVAFIRESLSTEPSLPLWDNYITLSARTGKADEALAFLREISARADLKPAVRELIDQHLASAFLAADHVEDGIAALREAIKAGAAASKATAAKSPDTAAAGNEEAAASGNGSDLKEEQTNHCLQLARIGILLGRENLVNEAIAGAKEALAGPRKSNSLNLNAKTLTELLINQGHLPEAENIAADNLVNSGKDLYSARTWLETLAVIYDQAGRAADVMQLLNHAPEWEFADVSDLSKEEVNDTPLLLVAARALAKSGKVDEAREAVRLLIRAIPGSDPAYEYFIELGGPDLEGYLDAQAAADPFEERPLIWKAVLQMRAGRLDEAEKTVRAAIKIDPSDGEEGKGDRMRAYAVLGDILEKKGLWEQAKTMRGIVEAIRISENADDWWEAGLLTRAVKMYKEALGHFADAYCIQSRLALRYSELGDFEKAAQHYKRAYELMPESFGRIESHCFACEGAFRGSQAQGIAERVFTSLAEKMPDNPQVFYLLGYLRKEQDEPTEAAAQFEKAAKLDPDYFNAWDQLLETTWETYIPHETIDAAVLAQLRLDPHFRHHVEQFQRMANLRALWTAILKQEKEAPDSVVKPIYPLAASKKLLESQIVAAQRSGPPDLEAQNAVSFADINTARDTLRAKFAKGSILHYATQLLNGGDPE